MKTSFSAFIFSACLATHAISSHAMSASDDFITKFSACDSGLFAELKSDDITWRKVAPVEIGDGAAWIKVPDRKDGGKNEVLLQSPVAVAGMELLSYFDEILELDSIGSYYFWGFTVKGDVSSVEKKIRALVFDNGRLRRDGPAFVRTELKVGRGPWQKANTASAAVGAGKIERVFLIEPHESRVNTVRLSCSLQGTLLPEVIKDVRPDIAFDTEKK